MASSRKLRIVAASAVLSVLAVAAAGPATARPAEQAGADGLAACGAFFDDFDYSSRTDPNFTAHDWSVRTAAGGPGVGGATWDANNISFPVVDGQKALQLLPRRRHEPRGHHQLLIAGELAAVSASRQYCETVSASHGHSVPD